MGAEVTDMSLPFQFISALAIAGSTFMSIVQVMPKPATEDFFEVHYITGKRVGDTAELTVNREIKQRFHMAPTVRIMEQLPSGWRQACIVSKPAFEYQPDAVLPNPVPLAWWTWDQCPTLPEGPARIISTWTPTAEGLQPITVITDIP